MKEQILLRSSSLNEEVVRLRRHFHKFPELSFNETKTASFICDYLRDFGFSYRKGIAGNGIIARVDGKKEGRRVIAVRAEMDALPVNENNVSEYASANPGKMHACGHDAHMAMLLGTARILKDISPEYGGTLLFVFQPGEEKSPGGARLMIEAGAFDDPAPDIILAQHVLPELDAGKIGYRPGTYMASCDEIYITVSGKGGHAAHPAMTTDQIYIASTLVVRLKDAVRRKKDENQQPTILGIGRISGEGATNVIPVTVEIEGTFRAFDESWRKEGLQLIRNVAAETAAEFGVRIAVNIAEGYPVLKNDEGLAEKAVELSSRLLGSQNVEIFSETRMSSDDFSFYAGLAPSLYFRVGIKKKNEEPRKLHTPDFDIDENCLATGMANMSWLILNFLST